MADLPETTRELKATLGPEDEELAAAFVELINEVALRRLTPEGEPRIRIADLEEVPPMLAQRIDEITHGWEKRGREKEAPDMFLDLFAIKFGEVPLPVRERVASATREQSEAWARRLLTAESPDDVFDD